MGRALAEPDVVPPAIELVGIEKRFGAVRANHNVNLSVARGSIHGIVGENGAGKSTLMSILYGFYEADAGEIRVDGKPVRIRSWREAIEAGIGMVHQHFMLVQPLSVLENVMLGAEGGAFLATGAAKLRATLARLGRDYGLVVDPDAIVGNLPVGLQQRVEILKALVRGARVLILDEPTAVLTPAEADQLFEMLRTFEHEGKTVLFITHKLREIMAITDRVSVMRRGEVVADFETAKTSPAELADAMVGRKVLLRVDKPKARVGDVRLEVRDLIVCDPLGVPRVNDISFNVRAGEIVGIAGVSGNGQSELLAALSGIARPAAGRILVDGADVTGLDPAELRERGLAHVPEDRHGMGLVLPFEENENAILGYHADPKFAAGPLLDLGAIRSDAKQKIAAYDVQPPNCRLKTSKFSGGNQQKIVLAREIERDPKVLLVGQPTRGVDIGAIEFIHRRLVALRDQGKAILLVSVELDEIMALADRIIVMCGGNITGERRPDATDQRDLGLLMAGVTEPA
ncbi:MAG: ABC transporter ATP-binding protein [Methylobacteriaceae bacterium]|nr:ABC transporter ATP-binding protein [Methylobacteriaceae bacterium]